MEIIGCGHGHYYNPELYSACPECAKEAAANCSFWFRQSSILRGCSQPEYLASGSSGSVYRVEKSGKKYALKVIDCGYNWQKFHCAQNEIALMKKLSLCKNIVPLFASELLEILGCRVVLLLEPFMTTLEEYYKSHNMGVRDILKLGIDICTALEDCWNAGVAHLDVQPKNLYVDASGHFCLGDFSVAVSTELLEQEQQLRGTLSYMAPEVYERRAYSQASDIYSLGMVLYCLLNHGNLPFMESGSKEKAVMTRMIEKVPVPTLNLGNPLDQLLERALAVDFLHRYSRFESMRLELMHVLKGQSAHSPAAQKSSRNSAFSWLLNFKKEKKQPIKTESAPSVPKPLEISSSGTLFDSDSFTLLRSPDMNAFDPFMPEAFCPTPPVDTAPIRSSLFDSDDFACTLAPCCPSTAPVDYCSPSYSSEENSGAILFDSDVFACTCPMDYTPMDSSSPAVFSPKEAGRTMFGSDTLAPDFSMAPPSSIHNTVFSDMQEPQASYTSAPRMSQVQFSAIAPKEARKEDYSIIQLFMYEQAFRSAVEDAIAMADTPVQEKRSGFQKVQDNTRVKIVLTCPDMQIDDNIQEQVWCGGYLQFDFAICPPEDFRKRQILLTASVYFDDVPATRLMMTIKALASYEEEIELARQDIITAFVSYASQDRTRVGALVQGMRKARPDMDIFIDVATLRSGENWENTLYREILRRDILFLCWSQNAMASVWVEREWRYALEHKGLEAIEPIPLEPPDACPPPRELWSKHFNDSLLYIINR